MELNRALNFVIPVEAGDGSSMYFHVAPISLAVFEEYTLVLAQTFSVIHQQGLGPTSGPRVAAILLKDMARSMGDDVLRRVQTGLIAEMHRLTNVLVKGDNGWETRPFAEVVKRLDEETVSEVENAIVFFMLGWRLYPKAIRKMMVDQAARLWNGSTSSLNCTEYAASLSTSSETENSGVKKVQASSVPS